MINRDGATCQNNNHFEHPTILKAPWDAHSTMFFKSVAALCFVGPFAVLGQSQVPISTTTRQYGRTDATKRIISSLTPKQLKRHQNLVTKHNLLLYDLEIWPTTLTYNPSLALVEFNTHTKNEGRSSDGSSRSARKYPQTHTHTQTNKRTLPNALSSLLRCR